jgi:CheY-like chemotaxis protein
VPGPGVWRELPAPGPFRLLVVDDEPDILTVLRSFLLKAFPGVEVDVAASGHEALAAMQRRPPDAILCDFRMPDMDGIEVLRQSVRWAPDARRLLMTAFADSSLPGRAAAAVALDGYVEKSAAPSQLRLQLAGLIGISKADAVA